MLYSVLLPVYNERENLPLMVSLIHEVFTEKCVVTAATQEEVAIRSSMFHAHRRMICGKLCSDLEYEIVVIDDNSPDGTGEVAEELRRLFGEDRIVIHKRPGKLGLGSAYVDGLEVSNGDFIILMDGDLSHHVRRHSWCSVWCALSSCAQACILL